MTLNGERRQDVGLKMVYVILTAIITLLLSVFFNKTYSLAEEAYEKSYTNQKDVAVLNQCYKDIDRRLIGIDFKIDTVLAKVK